jgi:starch phosphorylase
MELPVVAVTLVYRKGFFRQKLDEIGNQSEDSDPWSPEKRLPQERATAQVTIEGREVTLRAWRYEIVGMTGHVVPVYLLDADMPPNAPVDRALTDSLYGGDSHYRLCQEALLGLGGFDMLHNLGLSQLENYHMNEGHSSLLAVALLEEQLQRRQSHDLIEADIQAVRRQCIFTTHTPVPAGHDKFTWPMIEGVLGADRTRLLERSDCCLPDALNLTYLALRLSHYVNGVAMRHEEVSQGMFPRYPIHAITNGVHAVTWTSPSFQAMFDLHIPEWRKDNAYLRYAVGIPLKDIRKAHTKSKAALLKEVKRRTGLDFDESTFTIGFARRAAAYKRANLLFSDLDALRALTQKVGPIQIIYAGKAHPKDGEGKAMIQLVSEAITKLKNEIKVVYLEGYDISLAKFITSGVDLWLNTPQPPQEASGTSGMKAALNGIPSLSILDGWWIEGCFEGSTGWAIGQDGGTNSAAADGEAKSLYQKLGEVILPLFYRSPEEYTKVMRSAIAVNGSFFNTQRMLAQYQVNAYSPTALTKAGTEPR